MNDSINAIFLLDTGAEIISMSPKLAKKLNIDLNSKQKGNMHLADGSTTPGILFSLNSIQVGNAVAHNVKSVVLTNKSDMYHQIDGLLGMSFLKNFHLFIDIANKTLVLKDKSTEAMFNNQ